MMCFPHEDKLLQLIGIMNTNIVEFVIKSLNPTLNRNIGDINRIPVILSSDSTSIDDLVKKSIDISKEDWDSRETSWDFKKSPLLNETNA